MLNLIEIDLDHDIPGVHPAKQARSVRLRNSYIRAGIKLLNNKRLADISVSELARICDGSVGSFYTRFSDKEAYFRSLRAAAMDICNHEIHRRVNVDRLYEMSSSEVLNELVDLMSDIFTSSLRGVLRESLLRILEVDDPWAPMRESARGIMRNYLQACATLFPEFPPKETKTRLQFCFQLIVGALQNDLVNDYHVFSTKDESLRVALKETVHSYMRINAR